MAVRFTNKIKNWIYNRIREASGMEKSYTIIIHKEENPVGYWAECREMEECFAQAKTVEEVMELMKECIVMKLQEDNIPNAKEEIEFKLSYA